MNTFLRVCLISFGSALLLWGCATLPATVVPSKEISPDPLKLTIGYDLGLLRVDLKRATHRERRFVLEQVSNGVMKVMERRAEYVKVENPYSYLVADFGSGLVMDDNGNLGIDLLRLYHLETARSFNLTARFNEFPAAELTLQKSRTTFESSNNGLPSQRLAATFAGNVIELSGNILHRHMKIVRTPDSLSFEPSGSPSRSAVTVTQPAPGTAVFAEIGGKTTYTLVDSGRLRSTNGLDVTRNGKQIDIVFRSPGGATAGYVFTRTENGCAVRAIVGRTLIRVMRKGNAIYVTEDGRLTESVHINSAVR